MATRKSHKPSLLTRPESTVFKHAASDSMYTEYYTRWKPRKEEKDFGNPVTLQNICDACRCENQCFFSSSFSGLVHNVECSDG